MDNTPETKPPSPVSTDTTTPTSLITPVTGATGVTGSTGATGVTGSTGATPKTFSVESYDKNSLQEDLNSYISFIVGYKKTKDKKNIVDILGTLDSVDNFSSPPPFEELPTLKLNPIEKIDISKIHSFVSATIYSTEDDLLLQLYLLRLLYYTYNIARNVDNSKLKLSERNYKNDPTQNIVCKYDNTLMYAQYKKFSNPNNTQTRTFDQDMFNKLYDNVYKKL